MGQPQVGQRKTGRIIASWFMLVVPLFIGLVIFFPVFESARMSSTRAGCLSSMKQLALAGLMYSSDFDDRLPPAPTWADLVTPYSHDSDIFTCPGLTHRKPGQFGHAYRSDVGRKLLPDFHDPMSEPMLFDSSDLSWNATGSYRLVPAGGRHPDGVSGFAFLDGHVRMLTAQAFFELLRHPGPPGP